MEPRFVVKSIGTWKFHDHYAVVDRITGSHATEHTGDTGKRIAHNHARFLNEALSRVQQSIASAMFFADQLQQPIMDSRGEVFQPIGR